MSVFQKVPILLHTFYQGLEVMRLFNETGHFPVLQIMTHTRLHGSFSIFPPLRKYTMFLLEKPCNLYSLIYLSILKYVLFSEVSNSISYIVYSFVLHDVKLFTASHEGWEYKEWNVLAINELFILCIYQIRLLILQVIL